MVALGDGWGGEAPSHVAPYPKEHPPQPLGSQAPDGGEICLPQGSGQGAAGLTVYMPQPLALLSVAGPRAHSTHGLPATGLVLTTRRFPFSESLTFQRFL